jgi:hypothetical protein
MESVEALLSIHGKSIMRSQGDFMQHRLCSQPAENGRISLKPLYSI